MSTTSARMLALAYSLFGLIITAIPTRADDPPSKNGVRLDAVGDPLPKGAIARLGTLRLMHRGSVAAVAVSPDGKLVASGAHYVWPLIRLADVSDKPDIDELNPETKPRGIRLWDTRTGKQIRDLQTPNGQTSCLLFSTDGAELYGYCGNALGCWNRQTGEQRFQKSTPEKGPLHTSLPVSSLVLAGDRLVSVHAGSHNCEISGKNWSSATSHHQLAVRIWNRKTGELEPLPAILESTNIVGKDIPILFHQVAVSVDGRFAAVTSSYARSPLSAKGDFKGGDKDDKNGGWQYPNPRLRIIDLGTGVVRHDLPVAKIENVHMAFRDDGRLLAIAMGDELSILDVATGTRSRLAVDVPAIQKLRFMPGTAQIATEATDQSIRVWDYKTGLAIDRHAVRHDHFHASPNSPITAIGHENTIRLVDRDTGKALLDFAGHREAPIISFGSRPEGLLASLDSEQLFQWEPGTGKALRHLRLQAVAYRPWRFFRWRHVAGRPTVLPDKNLLIKSDEKALALHDLTNGKLIRTLETGAGKRQSSFFSQNGARVISMEEKRIVSFDVATGKRLAAIDHESTDYIWSIGFGRSSCSPTVSPSGLYFAKSDECKDVDLIRMDTGKHFRKLSGDRGDGPNRPFAILQLWFSPDERFLFAEVHRQLADHSGETVEIAIWDVERGPIVQEIVIVPRMQAWHRSQLQIRSLHAVAMSTDRRFIALARRDHGDVELWDTASATRRGILSGHEGAITDLGFSRDGHYLASASDDTTVLVWDLNRPLHIAPFKNEFPEIDFIGSWRTLAEADAVKADSAIWRLASAKAPSIAFLKTHLLPHRSPNPAHVKQLIKDLDSHDFKTRSLAETGLKRFREFVLSDLKAELTNKGSLELQRRIQLLLADAERAVLPFGTPDQVREWRALEVLERIATEEAIALLQTLAAGTPNSSLTVNAAEILARLRPRTK